MLRILVCSPCFADAAAHSSSEERKQGSLSKHHRPVTIVAAHLLLAGSIKRCVTPEHNVQHYAEAPDVHLLAVYTRHEHLQECQGVGGCQRQITQGGRPQGTGLRCQDGPGWACLLGLASPLPRARVKFGLVGRTGLVTREGFARRRAEGGTGVAGTETGGGRLVGASITIRKLPHHPQAATSAGPAVYASMPKCEPLMLWRASLLDPPTYDLCPDSILLP